MLRPELFLRGGRRGCICGSRSSRGLIPAKPALILRQEKQHGGGDKRHHQADGNQKKAIHIEFQVENEIGGDADE